MASGKTEHYGLSQWEAADQVVRTDFNSDNVKIDDTLHELAQTHAADVKLLQNENCWVKLKEHTLSADGTSVTLAVADVSKYREIRLYLSIYSQHTLTVVLRLNGISTNSYCETASSVGHSSNSQGYFTITSQAGDTGGSLSLYQSGLYSTGINSRVFASGYSYDRLGVCNAVKFSGLNTLNIVATVGSMAAGSTFALYGLKK